MGVNGKAVEDPSLYSLLQSHKADVFKSFHAVKIGQIKDFDAARRTASVQISFKRVITDLTGGTKTESYPLLVDCPVFTIQGGGSGFKVPVAAGDECLVLFADQNIDAWFENGGEMQPFDGRRHDISDGIALVGLNSLANELSLAVADDEAGFGDDQARVVVKAGKVGISNQTQDLLTLLTTLLTAQQALATALAADAGLQPATHTAATAAATAAGNAITALAALLYTPS